MARLSRIVLAGLPHHVTQRGNRRAPIFFEPGDQALYLDLMAERCRATGVTCLAYCLMPNHVHLILVPATADGLARAVGEAHRRYTSFVNARARQTGHLFQSRFSSVAMDEAHLLAAVRYVSLNPVRARLVARARDWRWSSVRAHLEGRDDRLVAVRPVLDLVGSFREILDGEVDEAALAALRKAETTGRPLGDNGFIRRAEQLLSRTLAPRKRGPKPREE
jgi:putative transposase